MANDTGYPAPTTQKRKYRVDMPGDHDACIPVVWSTSTQVGSVSVGRPDPWMEFTADITRDGRTFRAFAATRDAAVNEVVHAAQVWKWLREDMTEAEALAWLAA